MSDTRPKVSPPLPVVNNHFIPAALGPDGDLDHTLLDDPERLAHRAILLQDHTPLWVELHGQALGDIPKERALQELEWRDLGKEPDRILDQHHPTPGIRSLAHPPPESYPVKLTIPSGIL